MSEEKAKSIVTSWVRNPAKFVQEALLDPRGKGEKPTTQQLHALEEIRKLVNAKIKSSDIAAGRIQGKLSEAEASYALKQGVSIMSGQGTGKEAFCAWLILWFLCCYPYPKIPCTAPTGHQLKDNLWAEISKWIRGSLIKDWVVWQSDKVFFKESQGKEWFAVARTTNPKATPQEQGETLQGFHEDYLMVIIDEASKVPEPVFGPLEGTLTGKCNFIIMIFNPTRSSGFAVESHMKHRQSWVCLHWDGEESEMVTKTHVDQMAKKYGRDSNVFRIRIKGIPPKAEENILIPWEWIQNAIDRDDLEYQDDDPEIAGIDVGGGSDPSIFLRRKGPIIMSPIDKNDTPDSEVLTGWLVRKAMDAESEFIMVDRIGIGWAIEGNLRTRIPNAHVIGVNVSEESSDKEKFYRLRDELWWNVREEFEKGIISIPNDDELIGEVSVIRFDDSTGKIKVESKKDLKKRGIDSPNKADALCLTSYWKYDIMKKMKKQFKNKGRIRERSGWKVV